MQTIFLEFRYPESDVPAVLGTDAIFYLDGRWSKRTAHQKIYERVYELKRGRGKYGELIFLGYNVAGDWSLPPSEVKHKMPDLVTSLA
mgnify:CR=1 FL=1